MHVVSTAFNFKITRKATLSKLRHTNYISLLVFLAENMIELHQDDENSPDLLCLFLQYSISMTEDLGRNYDI